MKRFVRATRHGQALINKAAAYWLQKREKNPGLFDEELEDRYRALSELQISYATVTTKAGQPVHRTLMKKTQHWLYFTIDDDEWVTIHACWHTSRGKPPPLR